MIERLLLGAGVLTLTLSLAGLVRLHLARRDAYEPPSKRLPAHLVPEPARDGWAVIGFTAPLCSACRATAGIVHDAREQADLSQDAVAFVSADVREHGSLVAALEVRETPTVVLIDPDRRLRFASEGNPDPERLADVLACLPGSMAGRSAPDRTLASTVSLFGGEPPW